MDKAILVNEGGGIMMLVDGLVNKLYYCWVKSSSRVCHSARARRAKTEPRLMEGDCMGLRPRGYEVTTNGAWLVSRKTYSGFLFKELLCFTYEIIQVIVF
jgi:hypothetical protein